MDRSEYIQSLLTDNNLSFTDFLKEMLLISQIPDDGTDKEARSCENWNSILIKLMLTSDIDKAASIAVILTFVTKNNYDISVEDLSPDIFNITAGAYRKGLEDGKSPEKFDAYISGLVDYYESDDSITKKQKDILYNVLTKAYTLGSNKTSKTELILYVFTDGFEKNKMKDFNEMYNTPHNEDPE